MYIRIAAVAVSLGLMLACDADKDGLTNKEEKELGLDPKNDDFDGDGLKDGDEIAWGADPTIADSDGDYLIDGDEIFYGTDPMAADTDGDSYHDGWEVMENTDPLDKGDRIYKGKWPYNPEKSSLGNPDVSGTAAIGAKIGRLKADDQHGERVDLFDFGGANQTHKYIILDISAEWCGPCQLTSEWLSTGVDNYGHETNYGDVRKAVDNGEVAWVTVLSQDVNYNETSVETLESWDSSYPNKKIPVMTDPGFLMEDFVVGATGFFPSAVVIKAKTMKVEVVGGVDDALSYVQASL